MPKHPGRMIRKTISQSKKVSSLSPQALSLFCLLIPHFNSHGKMNGNPYFIKGEVVPIIKWFDIKKIKQCLKEITEKTNVKWFEKDGLQYIHSINWNNHQDLIRRRGPDLLPEYSGTDPGVVPPEFELEVEGKGKEEGEVEGYELAPNDESLEADSNGLDPNLKMVLEECKHLNLVSTSASSNFWDQVLGACEPYQPRANSAWLFAQIRSWNQWFAGNLSRRSMRRETLESRLFKWLTKDLEKLARTK